MCPVYKSRSQNFVRSPLCSRFLRIITQARHLCNLIVRKHLLSAAPTANEYANWLMDKTYIRRILSATEDELSSDFEFMIQQHFGVTSKECKTNDQLC